MIAFHFPPIGGSSGFLRTACFARYLRDVSWEPIVLTASVSAYPSIELRNNETVRGIEVHRAMALDAKRHLSWRGRYFRFTALPDQWASWAIPAIRKGLKLVKRQNPKIIWSTFPIPTALLIGYRISTKTGIPWVVDIRDIVVDDDFPESDIERKWYTRLEQRIARHASAVVVATNNAEKIYLDRYPELQGRLHVIRNGFDEEIFRQVESETKPKNKRHAKKVTLLHSGLLSAVDRNPIPFFDALVKLQQTGALDKLELVVILRACGDEERYRNEIQERDLTNIVRLLPAISYSDALAEMMSVDGLLLFQGATCNHAVPAKVYEYLRCGVPMFVAADPAGETASMLADLGCNFRADIESAPEIASQLERFVGAIQSGIARTPQQSEVMRFSRQDQAHALARLLSRLSEQASTHA